MLPSVPRTVLFTALALVAFAANSILCRLALRSQAIDPIGFTALRLLSGALALQPFLIRREGAQRRPWSPASGAALFVYALAFSLAYVWLDAGTGALLLFGSVQVTMIGAGLARGERPSLLSALGILTGAAGVVWLVLPGVSAPDPLGALLMAGAGVAWGAYSLLGRGVEAPAVASAHNFLLAACAGLAALAVAVARGSFVVSAEGATLAVASGALTSGLGYVLWYTALRGHSATSAAVVQLCVPVIAALAGVACLGEQASARLAGAGALTLGGVLVAVLARKGPARALR